MLNKWIIWSSCWPAFGLPASSICMDMAPVLGLTKRQASSLPMLSKQAVRDLLILIRHCFFWYSQTRVVPSFEQLRKDESYGFKSILVIESVWPMKLQRMLLSCSDQYMMR